MKKRDLLFYLAVFVALAASAVTCATVEKVTVLGRQMEQTMEASHKCLEENAALKIENDQLRSALWRILEMLEQRSAGGEDDGLYRKVAWTAAGEFRIFHYCPCEICTGKTPGMEDYGITRTGTVATAGRMVAVDPDIIPLGSEVRINGVVYIAEDAGVEGNAIDLYVDNHDQALAMGTYLTPVWWR